ncbi:hypothetical protein PM082_022222 [Marasmius tenuissimus]|nr:hypothetical protein PM082_022222 [Marasmius tenuissimus]
MCTVTDEIVEWLADHGFTLMNKKGEATHFLHYSNKTPSVIDLTWVNHRAMNTNIIQGWRVDPKMSYNSDHLSLRWTHNPGVPPINNVTGKKYNLSEVDPNLHSL